MRLVATVLVLASLVGCASGRGPYQTRPMTEAQLSSLRAKQSDCSMIDSKIAQVEEQLRMRGLVNANPEDLSEADRKFNAMARIYIWSLRIGCNNPNRYRQ